MLDRQKRTIDYLRISITDRCNLRCLYCMPAQGVEWKDHSEILRYEEIIKVVTVGAKLGVRRVRLTGGEPLVRQDVCGLVRGLKAIPGITEVSLTTNGVLLPELAADLRQGGLDRVNISLDTLDEKKFRVITRGGDLNRVWQGIEAAFAQGFEPVKINVVVIKGLNDGEVAAFANLTKEAPLNVRYIELMPLGDDGAWALEQRVSMETVREQVGQLGVLEPVVVPGAGPAKNFRLREGRGTIGFISAISDHFCGRCNRLRLTADGKLKPCLASDEELDLGAVLRSGATDREIEGVFREAVAGKPLGHHMEDVLDRPQRLMSQIGG